MRRDRKQREVGTHDGKQARQRGPYLSPRSENKARCKEKEGDGKKKCGSCPKNRKKSMKAAQLQNKIKTPRDPDPARNKRDPIEE